MTAFQNFLARVEPLPGIQSAAVAEILPLSQDDMDMGNFVIQDSAPLPLDEYLAANFRDVSPNYFRTMGIPLIQGRTFTDQDNQSHARVVIVDESFARNFFPNENPIGHHLQVPNAAAAPRGDCRGCRWSSRNWFRPTAAAHDLLPDRANLRPNHEPGCSHVYADSSNSSCNKECDLVGRQRTACFRS